MERAGTMKKEKNVKRRKRPVINSNLEHTVIAKDCHCKDFITLKAIKHHLKIFTKGHTKNRLYFQCTEKKWQRFYRLIMDRCIVEPAVKCPKWLQKKILKNLHAAAHSRIDPVGAETAEKLMEAVKRNVEKAASPVQSKTEKTDAHAHPNGWLLKPAPNVNPKRQKFMGNMFSKCVNSLRNFMSRKRCLQATHG